MIRKIKEIDNEVIIGRIGYIDDSNEDRMKISIVENYDKKTVTQNEEALNWIRLIGFSKVAQGLRKIHETGSLKGAIIVAIIKTTEKEGKIYRKINSFKIAKFPYRKKEE